MKPTKLFLILAVAMLLGANTSNAQSLTDTYWRNPKTGDWIIGFAEKHVIYDNAVWDIVEQTEYKGGYTLTVSNGSETRDIKVSPMRKGERTIAVGKDGRIKCNPITTSTLPDYPTRDNRQGFKDNGYRMGDSVTIVGWLKDMPQHKKAKIIEEIGVFLNNLLLDEYTGYNISLDSLGRFSITVPILNTTEVYLVDHLNVIEPGETYFYLHDYTAGKQLFMGNDVRLQNELVTHPFNYVRKQMRMRSATEEEEVLQFLKESDEERKVLDEELQQCIAEHPDLSLRYIEYVKHLHTMSQGRNLMMAQFNCSKFILPKELVDYVTTNIWDKAHQHPYTLCSDFNKLMYYYTIHADHCINSQSTPALPLVKRLAEEGAITLTDKEADALERFQTESDAMVKRLNATESEEEKQALTEAFNNSELVTAINALFARTHVDVHATIACDKALHVLDSVKHTPAMRNIYLSRKLYDFIDDMRQPLTPHIIEWMERNIQMEAAKAAVMELNDKYLALQHRDFSAASLKSADDVKGMSDGEKILRKLIEPYKGKFILLDVWGTWCGPCKRALAKSQEEYERLNPYDIVYLYLANNSSEESWKNVIKEYNVTGDNVVHYNLPAEQQTAIERFLGVRSYPTYKLIDRDGNILDVNADPHDLDALESLLKTMNGTKN